LPATRPDPDGYRVTGKQQARGYRAVFDPPKKGSGAIRLGRLEGGSPKETSMHARGPDQRPSPEAISGVQKGDS